MNENELYHHGVHGMKWGVRRYQNSDGSLTPLGRKRSAQLNEAFKPGKDGKASKAEKITKNVSDISNEVGKIHNSKTNRKMNQKIDTEIKKMSDAELNKKIDRMAREKRYRDLKYEQSTINIGRNKTDRILEIVGSVTAIGASATAIIASAYRIAKASD